MNLKPIIFGATGMVGEGVLHIALNDDSVESVLVVGRRSCKVKHPKLREILHDNFYDYLNIEQQFPGYNACFFCLGVTSVGKNEELYTRLTYDLTLAAAKTLSRLNPDSVFCYVSGTGTDSSESGKRMWARVKGKTENDLMRLPFKRVYAFRPGFIKPMKGLTRAFKVSKAIAPFYPLLRLVAANYVCTLEDLGRAMVQAAAQGYPTQILECRDIESASRRRGLRDRRFY